VDEPVELGASEDDESSLVDSEEEVDSDVVDVDDVARDEVALPVLLGMLDDVDEVTGGSLVDVVSVAQGTIGVLMQCAFWVARQSVVLSVQTLGMH